MKTCSAKAGEVLASSEVLKRLKIEEEDRQKKQKQHCRRRCWQQKNLANLHLNLIVNPQMKKMMIRHAKNVGDTGPLTLTKEKNLKIGQYVV